VNEPRKRRHIEREFGVPFAGEILDPAQWTQTALKKLPAEGRLDLETLFGRKAPLIVDLGCGNGRFLLGSAVWRPTFDHLGVDIKPVVIRYATRRGNQRGLGNLRFAVVDGERLLREYLPQGCATEIHCYHPQPYYNPGEVHRRMITPAFLTMVHRALIPGGQFFLQTDNAGYWEYLRVVLPCFFDFHVRIGRWPDAPKGRTRREIMALRWGLDVYRGWGTARQDLDSVAMQHLAESLPAPVFVADRRSRQLDAAEAEE
jgi:tRNA (guanine-N7-)-methyltransferase